MYITDQDYRTAIDERQQAIISRYPEEWVQAEEVAAEIAAGYLRSRYDVKAAYAKVGGERNPRLVLSIVHIALYQMVHRLPQGMGYERWKDRYDEAIAWLEDIQAGKTNPDLPLLTDQTSGKPLPSGALRFGSIDKSTYHY